MKLKVLCSPHPGDFKDKDNGIAQVVLNLAHQLENVQDAFTFVRDEASADIIIRHAGAQSGSRVDVAHCHGILPTAMFDLEKWAYGVNNHVVDNLIRAKETIVPSRWVADQIRRDMRYHPHIVNWGVNLDAWEVQEQQGNYVLWGKGRPGDVCSPIPMNKLAQLAPDINFTSTFGERADNVQITGQLNFTDMKKAIQGASVYLATTRETFGIQTLEAMACGIPVLGFNYAATPDIVLHGETGFLAPPDDYESLLDGLRYCLKHYKRLSLAAREHAGMFSWETAGEKVAEIYRQSIVPHKGKKVSFVIPCYNYEGWVAGAINSALSQGTEEDIEVIVVNDSSEDGSADVIDVFAQHSNVKIIHLKENKGVSEARNCGAAVATGEYISFLDADDILLDGWLAATLPALEHDSRCGIAYTPLTLVREDGSKHQTNWPPKKADVALQLQGHNTIPSCNLIRMEALKRSGGFSSRFEPTEDGELWMKIAELGYTYTCASQVPLYEYRTGHNSLSRQEPKLPEFYHPWHLPTLTRVPPFAAYRGHNQSYPVRDYDRPVISILIYPGTYYNSIQETLDSLLGQTFRFWEVGLAANPTPLGHDSLFLQAYPFVENMTGKLEWGKSPLQLVVISGEILAPNFLSVQLLLWQEKQELDRLSWRN